MNSDLVYKFGKAFYRSSANPRHETGSCGFKRGAPHPWIAHRSVDPVSVQCGCGIYRSSITLKIHLPVR